VKFFLSALLDTSSWSRDRTAEVKSLAQKLGGGGGDGGGGVTTAGPPSPQGDGGETLWVSK